MQEDVLVTIQGNQDRLIYEARERDLAAIPTLAYVIRDLGEEPIHWLSELPRTAVIEEDIFLCHGTPGSDTIYLLEDMMDGLPEVRSEGAIRELLQGVRSPVVLCGHTHIPRVVELSNGQLVVNPGSVGVPAYDDVDPVAIGCRTFHRMPATRSSRRTTPGGTCRWNGWRITIRRPRNMRGRAGGTTGLRGLRRGEWGSGAGVRCRSIHHRVTETQRESKSFSFWA